MTTAAIYYTPEGYRTTGQKLMGRHAAGEGFLRAFAATETSGVVWGHVPRKAFGAPFARSLRQSGFGGEIRIATLEAHSRLSVPGCAFMPGPGLGDFAWRRRSVGDRSYSLCGVTHTIASHEAMDAISSLMVAPLREWDALICTSTAVRDALRVLFEAQADYLRWRLGATRFELPQLPLIPLGVHCSEYEFGAAERASARAAMGIGDEDVVALFVGRLSFHAKAQPGPMLVALERAARKFPRRRIHLVQCGWFANPSIADAFRDAGTTLSPSLRHHLLDGREAALRRKAWAAADLFVSLADNIQETFGLTPIEAMAAGLPVVVSDWDGYRDTVRQGIDGFRIPSLTPAAPAGRDLAFRYAAGIDSYDMYCGSTCEFVAIDTAAAIAAIEQLVADRTLRQRLGDAGKTRAREAFEWRIVLDRYRALWADLAERRRASADFSGNFPAVESPARLDPFKMFRGYGSRVLDDGDRLFVAEGGTLEKLATLRALAVHSFAEPVLPSVEESKAIMAAIADTPGIPCATLLEAFPNVRRQSIKRGLVWLMKLDILRFPTDVTSASS